MGRNSMKDTDVSVWDFASVLYDSGGVYEHPHDVKGIIRDVRGLSQRSRILTRSTAGLMMASMTTVL